MVIEPKRLPPLYLPYLIDLVGADWAILGSDYGFDMGQACPIDVVTEHGGFDSAAQAQILGGTAKKLLRI